jgi:hypothetical protein
MFRSHRRPQASDFPVEELHGQGQWYYLSGFDPITSAWFDPDDHTRGCAAQRDDRLGSRRTMAAVVSASAAVIFTATGAFSIRRMVVNATLTAKVNVPAGAPSAMWRRVAGESRCENAEVTNSHRKVQMKIGPQPYNQASSSCPSVHESQNQLWRDYERAPKPIARSDLNRGVAFGGPIGYFNQPTSVLRTQLTWT